MYIFKNAFVSIWRNKSRNILIAIIITVIAAACTTGLAIRNSAQTIVKAYEDKNNYEATITLDRQSIVSNFESGDDSWEDNIEKFNEIENLTVDEINTYGDSNYLSSYYYTYTIGMDSSNIDEATDKIEKTTTETTTTKKQYSGSRPNMPPGFGGESSTTTTTKTKKEQITNSNIVDGEFSIVGYSSYASMSNFINGDYTITSGYVDDDFTSNSCVINSELATLNELELGDTIALVNPDDSSKTYKLVITGIYEDNSTESSGMSMYSSSVNTIITNNNFIETILTDDEDINLDITPKYVLKDKDNFEAFSAEVTEKGLSENYTVTSNIDDIDSETESVRNVSTFALTFLLITLAIGGVVLFVINMINIRERKYEIGVLRTIGMKKSLVVSQFVFELLIVAIIGLIIGAGIGAASSVKVANKLLENEISSLAEQKTNIMNNFGDRNTKPSSLEETKSADEDTETTEEDNEEKEDNIDPNIGGVAEISEFDSMDAVVDWKVLLELLAIGVFLTLISSSAAMISIANFSPLKILKERS
ncbi:MAG TPA: ABC transporter permease [Bacilli bacterium]|nr:ABC transporter permease [Bacilli bacterium]